MDKCHHSTTHQRSEHFKKKGRRRRERGRGLKEEGNGVNVSEKGDRERERSVITNWIYMVCTYKDIQRGGNQDTHTHTPHKKLSWPTN